MPGKQLRKRLADVQDAAGPTRVSASLGDVRTIPVSQIALSPHNPRRRLTGIEELAESVSDYGLLQPVIVRTVGDHYELIAGHRRLEAARQLGWSEIPAIERQESAAEAYLLTLIENLQRQDLSPKEEAVALEVLVRERGWSVREVASAIKRSPAHVSRATTQTDAGRAMQDWAAGVHSDRYTDEHEHWQREYQQCAGERYVHDPLGAAGGQR